MGLTINANGVGTVTNSNVYAGEEKVEQKNNNNIFGGDLNLAKDPLEERREEARKQAWQVVSSAWENDMSVDEQVEKRRNHYREMQSLAEEANRQLATVNDQKESLKEIYGVSDDSKEQEELELLEKYQDYMNGVSHERPSKEEMDRIAEIQKRGLTEYQSRALELNNQAAKFKLDMQDAQRQMRDDTSDIYRISQERLKSHAMVDAQKAAEAIMEAANEEILQTAAQEGVDNIDEKMEEAQEKAEENMEEQEEKEEHLEEIKEMRALQEAVIEGTKEALERAEAQSKRNAAPDIELTDMVELIQQQISEPNTVQQDLDDIKSSMKVLEADLKGIKVDKEI